MQLTKKISILAFVLFFCSCASKKDVTSQPPSSGDPSSEEDMGKFAGDWILVSAPPGETPEETIVMTFDSKGVTSYDVDGTIEDYRILLTPVKQFKFTDKPEYVAYIYNVKQTVIEETDTPPKIYYTILWSTDGTKILEANKLYKTLEEVQDLATDLASTDDRIQGIFAKKK